MPTHNLVPGPYNMKSAATEKEPPLVNYIIKDGDASQKTPLLEDSGSSTIKYNSLEDAFDLALDRMGIGIYHIVLVFICGWALASDSVEIQCISFVTPQLDGNKTGDYDITLNKTQDGILDAMIFLGMMVGGYTWGSLSDMIGRRSCLITSLTVNGIFGLASAFSPNYATFLLLRFFSGVGVGGSMPVVFSYYCEFYSRRWRGPFVITLASFWIIGSIFAALVAWIVIGHFNNDIHSHIGSMEIQAWRLYIILCTFPCLSSALCFILLPESPSFLFNVSYSLKNYSWKVKVHSLQKRKLKKTSKILKRVQKINSHCGRSKRVCGYEEWNEYLSGLLGQCHSLNDKENNNTGRWTWIRELFRSTQALFSRNHIRATIIMIIIFFMFSSGYYGLLLWFPEYFKYIEDCNYARSNNCTLDPGSSATSCVPSGAIEGCDLTNDNDSDIYSDSLYVALAAIPGTVIGIITVNMIGAKSMLIFSLVVSGLSTLLIWIIPDSHKTERVIVILSSLFSGVSIIGWNSLDVICTSQLFPVHLRSTAFGIQSVFGRIGAITGNISFGRLFAIGATPYLPILIVASVLIFAGLATIILPSPQRKRTSCHWLQSIYLYFRHKYHVRNVN